MANLEGWLPTIYFWHSRCNSISAGRQACMWHNPISTSQSPGEGCLRTAGMCSLLRQRQRNQLHILAEPVTCCSDTVRAWGGRLGRRLLRSLLRSEVGVVAHRRAWHDSRKLTAEVLQQYKAPLQVEGWDRALIEVRLPACRGPQSEVVMLLCAQIVPHQMQLC